MKKMQVLRERFAIVERRDGCVWKTASLGHLWLDHDYQTPEGFIDASPSTTVTAKRMGIRMVPFDTPSLVEVSL